MKTGLKHISRILLAGALLFTSNLESNAQISYGGQPRGYNTSKNLGIDYVQMPSIDTVAVKQHKKANNKVGPMVFGEIIETEINLFNSGNWETLKNGDRIWRTGIQSDGAYSINLVFDDFFIPDGGQFFIYNKDKTAYLGSFTSKSNRKDSKFATDLLSGEAIVLEYFEPADVAGEGAINVSKVVHGYVDMKSLTKALGDSDDCHVNVVCEEGDEWVKEASAVALILVGSKGFCTGTLINNVNEDKKPYFLTAEHCLNGSENLWIYRFNYNSPDCDVNKEGPTSQSVLGSTVLAEGLNTDFALLLLDTLPPDDYEVQYAGWSRNTPTDSLVGIHHPQGDVKKISLSYSNADLVSQKGIASVEVVWDLGTTEIGSSGSPLFNQQHQVVGQLYGGNAACNKPNEPDYYGDFSTSWSGSGTSGSQLKAWLDPNSTNTMSIDRYDPNRIINNLDAKPISARDANPNRMCKTRADYVVILRNQGLTTLASVQLDYDLNGGQSGSVMWTGSLLSSETTEIPLPTFVVNNGVQNLTVTSRYPNGGIDDDTLNDVLNASFVAIDSAGYFTLNFKTDNYGDETSWYLKDENNVIVYSGTNYDNNTIYKENLCYGKGCYTFVINDYRGDGLCCEYGDGYYSLVASNGDLIGLDNEFEEASWDTTICFDYNRHETTLLVHGNSNFVKAFVSQDEYIESIEIYTLLGQFMGSETYDDKPKIITIEVSSIKNTLLLARVKTNREVKTLKFVALE
ncbi:MAG: trypsin-like peptidase domain-containing protein [Flavobacteriales bacterium]|nr:trypsin-like peptidase domain-containing protein [Flavobacteriales bacterium]